MKTLKEIEARLSAIKTEISAEGADVDKLSKEADGLLAERKSIMAVNETRKATLESIAAGITGTVVKDFGEKDEQRKSYAVDSAEYRSAYMRSLQGKELTAEERTAVTAAGAVIPTQTVNAIIGKLQKAPLLSAVDMTYIPGNVSFPKETASADASWASTSTDSADTFGNVSLSAYQLVKTIEITANVEAMSIDAFESWLVERLSNKMNVAVDNAILNGTGSSQPTGLLKSGEITTTGTYTKAGMKLKDLMTIIGAIPTEYVDNATFVMPRATFYGEVLGMETTAGERVVVADPQAPAKFSILGFPVIIDDKMTADKVLFGDLKAYKFNFAKMPVIDKDTSVGFRSGSTVYRALALADGKLADANAVCLYSKATA